MIYFYFLEGGKGKSYFEGENDVINILYVIEKKNKC